MNIPFQTNSDQIVPISKARATLPSLIEKVAKKDFYVLVKKYQPKVALVDLKFFKKLMEIYNKWEREQDFLAADKILESIPEYPSEEVEKDIEDAIRAVRKKAKNSTGYK